MEFSVDILIISPFYQLRPIKQRESSTSFTTLGKLINKLLRGIHLICSKCGGTTL